MRRPLLAAALLLAAAPAAKAESFRKGSITVEAPVARASLGRSPNTAAYLTIRNSGSRPDRLLGASCACAAGVEIHRHETAGGVMRMRAVPALAVPARGVAALRPGDGHALMVTGLKRPLAPGEAVAMTLRFERAGPLTVRFTAVRDVAAHAH